jgi:trimeric autotransporter adhesin
MNRFVKHSLASVSLLLATLLCAAPALAAGTPVGTSISNQATVDYTDANGNPMQTLSNIVTTIVSQVSSVTVDPDRASTATPGDTLYYAHTVTNNSNGADTVDLTAVSSNGWVTALFFDADGSGTFTPGDVALGDTDGDTTPDTGALGADGTYLIMVSVAVPNGIADAVTDTITVTGTSSLAPFATDIALDTTTVNAPTLSVVKSVLPGGPQPPTTVLTYTIVVTNNGQGNADAVIVTDPIPGFTTYVAGSLTLNGGGLTDAGLDDAGDFGSTAAGAITVTLGTLAPGGSATVTFQVTID